MHDLVELAREPLTRQAGLVTRAQLRELRLRDDVIDGLVRRRRLVALARGLYRIAGATVPAEQPAWAAVLATGGLLIGEHLFALLDIEGGSFAGRRPCSSRRSPAPRTGLVLELVVGTAARWDIGGLQAASVAAAVVEYAATARLDEVRRVVDSARWLGHVTVAALLAEARRRPLGHLGAQKVRWMDEAGLFDDESQGERTLDRALGTLGLLFRKQVEDVVPGRRLDRYCDLARLALEYDGRVGERDLDRDAAKDLEAAAVGVLILHVTVSMIRPGATRATVRRIAEQVQQRAASRARAA